MALFGESVLFSYLRLAPIFLNGDGGEVGRLARCIVGPDGSLVGGASAHRPAGASPWREAKRTLPSFL